MNTPGKIEARIRRKRLPGLANLPDGEFVMPCYDGLSIANVPATVAVMLGITPRRGDALPSPLGGASPLIEELWSDLAPGLRRVVLVILDAVGYLAFRAALAEDENLAFNRLIEAGRLVPLTSVFPSTTTAALSSLWTGRTPAEHGLLGYELYLREYGTVANMIHFSPVHDTARRVLLGWGLDPERFLPVPGLAEILAQHGVTTRVLIHNVFVDSPLSRINFRGASEIQGFVTSADMWVSLRHMLTGHRDERLLVAAYWGSVDGIAHLRGPASEAWAAEIRNLAYSLEREFLHALPPDDRQGTLLLITADHGQVYAPPQQASLLSHHPRLRDALLLPPTGESRAAYLYPRHGRAGEVRRYFEKGLGQRFVVLESAAALEAGLFGNGPPASNTTDRIGDLIALARGNNFWHWSEKEIKICGRHGGLVAEEMLVPFLAVRLDDSPW